MVQGQRWLEPQSFEIEGPYRHWSVRIDAPLAWVVMDVDPQGGLRESYTLKLNSYDLGVDIELADIVQRMRFEHPDVRVVILTSAHPRAFCAGANIEMLSQASHAAKVNFCKFTNETRCAIEDATEHSGQIYLAACNGTTAGGGYELALACQEIYLQDDGHAAVSLPEVALLGVLPGTGGLTRLVDKRNVRRDHADVFCTTPAGIRGPRAQAWRLVDGLFPRSTFAQDVEARARALARERLGVQAAMAPREQAATPGAQGIRLRPLVPQVTSSERRYRHVALRLDAASRTATLEVQGPTRADVEALLERAWSDDLWALRCFRELDDALLHLRTHHRKVGLVVVRAVGDPQCVLDHDIALAERKADPLIREVVLHMARVLRRMDNTTRSFFALADRGTAFAGCLLELALASDRIYLLDDDEQPVKMGLGPCNHGLLPSLQGSSRVASRWTAMPELPHTGAVPASLLDARQADALGLATMCLDALEWDDEVRLAIEERLSLSPDALVGMEQNLRFPGPENTRSKIFARLSAWQNWIFGRPNATGPKGALTLYGQPERPQFSWERI